MDERKKLFAAVGVLTAFVAVLGVELFRRNAPPERPILNLARPDSKPEPQPDSKLYEPAPTMTNDEELEFGKMMDYLDEGSKKTPAATYVAKKFVKEFNSHPPLKAVYKDFKRRQASGERPKASEFMGSLRKEASFQSLVSRFSGGGNSSAILAIASQPHLQRFLKGEFAGLSGGTFGKPGATNARARTASVRGGSSVSGAAGSGNRSSSAMGSGLNASSALHAGGGGNQTMTSQAGGVEGGAVNGAGGIGGGTSGGTTGGGGTTGSQGPIVGGTTGGGHKVPPRLPPPVDPKTERIKKLLEAYPFLINIFTMDELWALITGDMEHGLWGACFKKGKFAQCYRGCQAAKPTTDNPGVSCTLPGGTGWTACMDAFDKDEAKCVAYCAPQDPCRPDGSVWDRFCAPVPPPSGYTKPAYCGPEPRWPVAGCRAKTETCWLYGKYLDRIPERAGAMFWENLIEQLKAEGKSTEQIYAQLGPQFASSLEGRARRGYQVTREELAAARAAHEAWVRELRIGNAEGICDSDEANCLISADDNVVIELYKAMLGRAPDAGGLAFWKSQIRARKMTVADFEAAVKSSPEYQARNR